MYVCYLHFCFWDVCLWKCLYTERWIKDGGPLEVDGFQNAHWQKGHCHTQKCLVKQNRAKKPRYIQVHFVNSNMTKLKDIALKWVFES